MIEEGRPELSSITKACEASQRHRMPQATPFLRPLSEPTTPRQNRPPVPPSPRTGGSTTGSETSAPSAKSSTAAMPWNSGRGPRNPAYAKAAPTQASLARRAACPVHRNTGSPECDDTPIRGNWRRSRKRETLSRRRYSDVRPRAKGQPLPHW